ncbi:MAG: hypothetical protein Q8L99_14160 [Polycyclovorans sp.]|nr:hypothetical protein [Polycyclovorans sp.]MEC8847802.1 hypothetical protein [Pseudomonadota bacterium]
MAAERRAADAIVAALLALCVSPAWACRCAPQTLAEYFQRAGVVMQVRVEQVEIMGNGVGDGDGHAHRRAQFTRLQDYKNAAGVDSLRTALDGAACGLALQPGARYWIFGTLAPGSTQVRTGSCDGSRPIDQGFTDVAADAVHEVLLEQRRALDCPSPAPAEIAARLQLTAVPRAETAITTGERSPNGAYAFWIENPSPVQRPPRIAKLLIDREREEQLELRLHGIAAAASAQWVNEKLVLVRVPWSRHLRSDVLVDVERAAILSVDSARLDETGRVRDWLDADCRHQP